jgi:hypothetical protein
MMLVPVNRIIGDLSGITGAKFSSSYLVDLARSNASPTEASFSLKRALNWNAQKQGTIPSSIERL